MMRRIGLRELFKDPFRKPSPLEMIATELAEAHLSKLEAETAAEYANAAMQYNEERIKRLEARLKEHFDYSGRME